MRSNNNVYWIYLQNVLGYGSRKIFKVLDVFGSVKAFYNAPYKEKISSKLFNKSEINRIEKYDLDFAYKTIEKCEKLGYKIITPENPLYPMRLKHIINPPAVLYVYGNMPDIDNEVAIAIVGARKASGYSRALTYELSERLTKAGAFIVSGGAVGIDTSAHTGALRAKGNTIAILACGLNYGYLATNDELRMDIASNGALISEFQPDYPVFRHNFQVRNRLISGLCLGTVVVEAGRKSGALITVEHALEQGRDIFVIPGDLSSERYVGSNRLIRDGAKVITSPLDILEEYTHIYPHKINIMGCGEMLKGEMNDAPLFFDEDNREDKKKQRITIESKTVKKKDQIESKKNDEIKEFVPDKSVENLSDNAKKLYLAFYKTVMLFDELVEKSGLSVSNALSAATELEIMGIIEAMAGERYKVCL
ncbi:MAG: DNA-processing protein DprA [Clostridia bacterium]|nr:DNA-processing protein DprA [Clostridia bacterium]